MRIEVKPFCKVFKAIYLFKRWDIVSKDWARLFYKSMAWRRCRASYIAYRQGIDGGMCEVCRQMPGVIVHHKVHLTPDNITDPDVSLAHSNLQLVCKHCHDVIHGYCEQSVRLARVSFDADGNPVPKPQDD